MQYLWFLHLCLAGAEQTECSSHLYTCVSYTRVKLHSRIMDAPMLTSSWLGLGFPWRRGTALPVDSAALARLDFAESAFALKNRIGIKWAIVWHNSLQNGRVSFQKSCKEGEIPSDVEEHLCIDFSHFLHVRITKQGHAASQNRRFSYLGVWLTCGTSFESPYAAKEWKDIIMGWRQIHNIHMEGG